MFSQIHFLIFLNLQVLTSPNPNITTVNTGGAHCFDLWYTFLFSPCYLAYIYMTRGQLFEIRLLVDNLLNVCKKVNTSTLFMLATTMQKLLLFFSSPEP